MRVVLVHKTIRKSGRVVTRDEVLDVERVAIGRAADSEIPLSGLEIELHHSELRKQPDGVHVQRLEAKHVDVNGRKEVSHRLKPKDVVRVGGYQLTVLQSVGDEDVRMELEAVSKARSALENLQARTFVGLSHGLLTERTLSWAAVLLIPLIFVILPIASRHILPQESTPITGAGTGPGAHMVKDTHAILETFWDTGPMARAHSNFAEDCAKCHVVPFTRVLDNQCLACHGDIPDHVPNDIEVVDLETTRCADCHMEHNGPFDLQRLDQELCAECHVELERYAPNTRVKKVTDFGIDHPEFRLTVPDSPELTKVRAIADREEQDVWTRKLERLEWAKDLQERSGVKFNHVRHVAREEIKGSNGKLLDCGTCHQTDEAGKNMLDIEFERDCQSCHSIGFDVNEEKRQAIHGDPVAMRRDILEFYTSVEVRKLGERSGVLRERVARGELTDSEKEEARKEARVNMEKASRFLFKNPEDAPPGACANCHFVKDRPASDGFEDVEPVRLLNLWMPKSVFRHQTHEPSFACRDCHPASAVYDPTARASYEQEKDLPENPPERPDWSRRGEYSLFTPEELLEQHQLEPSRVATDVLIPGLDRCTTCHAGANAKSPLVASECVLCHPFHRKEYDRMRQNVTLPAAQNKSELSKESVVNGSQVGGFVSGGEAGK